MTAVEWPERLPESVRADAVLVTFDVAEEDGARQVGLSSDDERLRGAARAAEAAW